MARGDHFFLWRRQGAVPFQHHGIDLGDGTVVHFADGEEGVAGPGGTGEGFFVRRTPIGVVTRGGRDLIHIVEHGDRYSADETVRRAKSRIGDSQYHLVFDNCEHFATWCVVGRRESRQIDATVERLGAASAKAALVGSARVATRSGVKRLAGSVMPWLVASDAAQWMVEVGGHHLGIRDPQHRKRAGRAVGLTTALGIGALAGPAGLAVAGSAWVAGEVAGEVSRRWICDRKGVVHLE